MSLLTCKTNQTVHLRYVLNTELWRVPRLQSLNAQSNQLKCLSEEIIHCQSLSKLILDCNDLKCLPTQVTKLRRLKYLSLAGNLLRALPNGTAAALRRAKIIVTTV